MGDSYHALAAEGEGEHSRRVAGSNINSHFPYSLKEWCTNTYEECSEVDSDKDKLLTFLEKVEFTKALRW